MKKYYKYLLLTGVLFLAVLSVAAQEVHVISGTVYDKNDRLSMPGITIRLRDIKTHVIVRNRGTLSDLDGNFNIKIHANQELVFSYVGYETVIWGVSGSQSNLKVYMVPKIEMLEETVIVGYQNKSKADVTSSVTVVDTKDLALTPVANVMELLQGRVAGLNLQMNNGTPGAMGQIMMRGVSDISIQGTGDNMMLTSSAPLFVVDGIPQDDMKDFDAEGLLSGSGVSPLSMIPFEDIDNIQILKDAAATSLYGSRGAYGVVLITTKRGNSPKPVITYSGNYKINTPPNLRDVAIGTAERRARIWQILQNDTSRYSGFNEIHDHSELSDSLNPYYNNHTDWQGQFYRVTQNQTHNLSVSGGDQAFNYKINGNYYTEKGVIENTDFNRYGIAMNMGYKPTEKFRLDASMRATFAAKNNGSGSAFSQTGVATGSSASSLLPPPSLYSASNETLGVFTVQNDNNTTVYDTSLNMEYQLPWNIRWSGTFGYKHTTEENEKFTPGILSAVENNPNRAIWYNESSNSNSIYGRTSLSYNTRISAFKVGLMVGAEISTDKSTGNVIELKGLASDYIWGPVGGSPSLNAGKASLTDQNNTVSFTFNPSFGLGSLSVGGVDKYVFNPTIRPEANSAYGNKVKWTINPGLGFRWNFSYEKFCDAIRDKFLSSGSLRLSWGQTTKYKANRYDIWGTYDVKGDTYNGSAIIPINFDQLPNPTLDPVTTTQWNMGLDLNLWNRRLTLVTDLYYKQTDNQISNTDLANHNGFSKVKTTKTSIVNYGLEFQASVRPLPSQSNWDLNCMFSFAINKDVIAKLPDEARQIINDNTVVNKLGSNALGNYLYIYKGVYATNQDVPVDPTTGLRLRVGGNTSSEAYFKAGDPIWADINGDYIIDEHDKVIVGNSQPRVTGGISLNLRYKSFSVNTNCSFVAKRDIINKALADKFDSYTYPLLSNADLQSKGALIPINAYNFWTPENRIAQYPNPYDYYHAKVIDPFRTDQTLFMEDGSYFKINTISFSYQVHKNVLNFFRISSMTLNASANNIWTFSGYSGINPESVNSLGYDTSGGYPNARAYTIGVTVRF